MGTIDTRKMRICSHLLPDPGGEVVRGLLDEYEALEAENALLMAEIAAFKIYRAKFATAAFYLHEASKDDQRTKEEVEMATYILRAVGELPTTASKEGE